MALAGWLFTALSSRPTRRDRHLRLCLYCLWCLSKVFCQSDGRDKTTARAWCDAQRVSTIDEAGHTGDACFAMEPCVNAQTSVTRVKKSVSASLPVRPGRDARFIPAVRRSM